MPVASPVVRYVAGGMASPVTGFSDSDSGGGMAVLDKDGNSFAVSFAVLDKDGNSFTVTNSVLDKDGNPHTVI
jgi:hypothetical protein